MKKKMWLLTALLVFALGLTACGNAGNDSQMPAAPEEETSPDASEEATEPETTEETIEDTGEIAEVPGEDDSTEQAAVNEGEDATQEEMTEETDPETSAHPYAWLGLEDIPPCPYLDLISSAHYIQTYDYYVMGLMTEETEAVDGVNSFAQSNNSRRYTVEGKVLSMDDASKNYMEVDMSDMYDTAVKNLQSAMQSGTNSTGRHFIGTGEGVIPLYSDEGDTAEYSYYEYDYPESEAVAGKIIERFYMKDGDVFAIYQQTILDEENDTMLDYTKVIKTISGDIPEGTFDLPDLTGYTAIE